MHGYAPEPDFAQQTRLANTRAARSHSLRAHHSCSARHCVWTQHDKATTIFGPATQMETSHHDKSPQRSQHARSVHDECNPDRPNTRHSRVAKSSWPSSQREQEDPPPPASRFKSRTNQTNHRNIQRGSKRHPRAVKLVLQGYSIILLTHTH